MPNRTLRRPRSIAAISAAALAGVVLCATPAHAQVASAEALFEEGNKLLAAGDVVHACDAFEASNHAEARAGTLIRLGECREQNGQLASAWSAYKDALARAKDPHKRDVATEKVASIEPRLSYLTVSLPAGHRAPALVVTRGGQPIDPLTFDHALPIDGGDYVVAAYAPGRADWQVSAHVPGEGGHVTIEVPELALPSPTEPAAQPPVAPPPVAITAAGPRRFTRRREVALGVGGAAVVSGVIGIAFGLSASSNEDAATTKCMVVDMCTDVKGATRLNQAAVSRALDANIAFGAAAALAIGAGVLWFTGAPAEHPPRATLVPTAAPGQAGLALVGAF